MPNGTKTDAKKEKFIRLAKRGKGLERAWDRAVSSGDLELQKRLTAEAEKFYRAWGKYEAMGFQIFMVRGEYQVREVAHV